MKIKVELEFEMEEIETYSNDSKAIHREFHIVSPEKVAEKFETSIIEQVFKDNDIYKKYSRVNGHLNGGNVNGVRWGIGFPTSIKTDLRRIVD